MTAPTDPRTFQTQLVKAREEIERLRAHIEHREDQLRARPEVLMESVFKAEAHAERLAKFVKDVQPYLEPRWAKAAARELLYDYEERKP